MKRRSAFLLVLTAALFALLPATVAADSAAQEYVLELEVPNVSEAPNGDQVAVTGEGEFSVHPKSVEAEGTFVHTDKNGGLVARGTWEATDLLAFQLYGCGIVLGTEIDPSACGGMLKLRVHLTVTAPAPIAGFQTDGILTIFCIIGANPPNSHDDPSEEGIHLVVPGIANFNKIISGMNVYIRE